MTKKQPWLIWGFVLAMVFAIWANFALAPRPVAYLQGKGNYNINELVEQKHWIESAPIVLTNHFSYVRVYRLGDVKKYGVSFDAELARIFKVKKVTRNKPLDIRKSNTWPALADYVQYGSQAACRVDGKPATCLLYLVWDDTNSSPIRDFVTARVGRNSFALVDSNLLRNIAGVSKW